MRHVGKIPRIIKINSIDGLLVSVVFNNGERRSIDFKKVYRQLRIDKNPGLAKLLKPLEFKKVHLANHTLSWENVNQFVHFNGKKIKVPFEIGADVLYRLSSPENDPTANDIGQMIRNARIKAGLTQDVLANRSGTTRNYISRIENNQSGIEMNTLKKIVESGLGAKFDISISGVQKHQVPKHKAEKNEVYKIGREHH